MIKFFINFYFALVNHCGFTQEKLLAHNSGSSRLICAKQILFGMSSDWAFSRLTNEDIFIMSFCIQIFTLQKVES